MGDGSAIEWTEATWNPIVGCSAVSPGCDNCYAERQSATRLSKVPAYAGLTEGGKWTGELRFLRERLDQPLRWRRPRRIFVNSMSDLFHPEVDDLWIAEVFAVMSLARRHTFQVLTKRPKAMAGVLADPDGEFRYKMSLARKRLDYGAEPFSWPLPNVWLGTSIESQQYAFRARYLLDTPAAVRFVSAEPLLGPLDLSPYLELELQSFGHGGGVETFPRVDWVIVGGESGPGARPMHPDWARSLRDQCQEAGVPFLFKQHGEWVGPQFIDTTDFHASVIGTIWPDGRFEYGEEGLDDGDARTVWKAGKHRAGRFLDGRTWDEYPA